MSDTPDYSIIVPAYNEASELQHTLGAMKAAMAGVAAAGELIVVDNNSSDETAEVARALGAMVVFEPVNMISKARNAGAAASGGRWLIFIDADTSPSAELLSATLEALEQGGISVGGARIEMDPDAGWAARRLLGLWNVLSRWLGWPAGCYFFCTRQGFEAVGGFNEAIYASEEIWLARRLKKWGRAEHRRAVILPEAVVTSSRKTDDPVRMFGMLLIMFGFPLAVRFKGLCGYWYKRKDDASQAV